MFACIIITSLALYWLMVETKYLTIRLTGLDLDYSDYQYGYDGSDSIYLDDYEKQHRDMINEMLEDAALEADYQAFLGERYSVESNPQPARSLGNEFTRRMNMESTADMRAVRITQAQLSYGSRP